MERERIEIVLSSIELLSLNSNSSYGTHVSKYFGGINLESKLPLSSPVSASAPGPGIIKVIA